MNDVTTYYRVDGAYAGTLFMDVEPNDPYNIEAADLYAVTTSSRKLDGRHGRLLLFPRDMRSVIYRLVRQIDPDLPLTDLGHGHGGSAEILLHMYELHQCLRSLLGDGSQRWVTAAKLCARKRPRLFPVRDNLVCEYLSEGRIMRRGDGWPGDFSVDIQIYASLVIHPAIKSALMDLRQEIEVHAGVRVDGEDLRLLDSALCMAAGRSTARS